MRSKFTLSNFNMESFHHNQKENNFEDELSSYLSDRQCRDIIPDDLNLKSEDGFDVSNSILDNQCSDINYMHLVNSSLSYDDSNRKSCVDPDLITENHEESDYPCRDQITCDGENKKRTWTGSEFVGMYDDNFLKENGNKIHGTRHVKNLARKLASHYATEMYQWNCEFTFLLMKYILCNVENEIKSKLPMKKDLRDLRMHNGAKLSHGNEFEIKSTSNSISNSCSMKNEEDNFSQKVHFNAKKCQNSSNKSYNIGTLSSVGGELFNDDEDPIKILKLLKSKSIDGSNDFDCKEFEILNLFSLIENHENGVWDHIINHEFPNDYVDNDFMAKEEDCRHRIKRNGGKDTLLSSKIWNVFTKFGSYVGNKKLLNKQIHQCKKETLQDSGICKDIGSKGKEICKCTKNVDDSKNIEEAHLMSPVDGESDARASVDNEAPEVITEQRLNENLWERHNFGLFAKIFLMMFLFNAPKELYLLLLLCFVLHLQGFFNVLINWMTLSSSYFSTSVFFPRLTLDQVLIQLDRRRQFKRACEILENEERTKLDEKGVDATVEEVDSSRVSGMTSGIPLETSQDTEKPDSNINDHHKKEEKSEISYFFRLTYQLFVMFFMTLFPWWIPNLRYLED